MLVFFTNSINCYTPIGSKKIYEKKMLKSSNVAHARLKNRFTALNLFKTPQFAKLMDIEIDIFDHDYFAPFSCDPTKATLAMPTTCNSLSSTATMMLAMRIRMAKSSARH